MDGAGAGFEGAGLAVAVFVVEFEPALATGFGTTLEPEGVGLGFSAGLDTPGRVPVREPSDLAVAWVSGFDGRGSWFSAFRFVPPLRLWRDARSGEPGAGLRLLFFGVEAGAGGAGCWDSEAGLGLPV